MTDGVNVTRYQLGGRLSAAAVAALPGFLFTNNSQLVIFYPRSSEREPWVSRLTFYCSMVRRPCKLIMSNNHNMICPPWF